MLKGRDAEVVQVQRFSIGSTEEQVQWCRGAVVVQRRCNKIVQRWYRGTEAGAVLGAGAEVQMQRRLSVCRGAELDVQRSEQVQTR